VSTRPLRRPPFRSAALRAAAIVSMALTAVAAAAVRREDLVVGAVFVAALAWSAFPAAVDAFLVGPRRARSLAAGAVPVAAIVRLGDEPAEVARASIVVTATSCPTIVVSTRRRAVLDDLGPIDVQVCVAETIEAAVRDAAALVTTPGVVVHSAGAFPRVDACRRAAARLDERVGWIVGESAAINDDGYAPDGRERVLAALRRRARRSGLDLWERDAVVVRTDLLREHPLRSGHPWGAWLRHLRRAGFEGGEHPEVLSSRVTPVGAESFWPSAVLRKRAMAADLADASRAGPTRARLHAFGLLLRELHAYPLLVWLLAPVLLDWSGGVPFHGSPWLAAALAGSVATLRWLTTRLSTGAGLRPVQDAFGVAYDIPGSLLALPPALTRHVRPSRLRLPDRPHVWIALLLVVLLAVPVVGRSTPSPASRLTVALAFANLALLWAVALRALLQRTWTRATYRFPLHVPATIGGAAATTLDASPSGLAVVGVLDDAREGRTTEVCVSLPDGPLHAAATVVDRRHRRDHDVVGVSLRMDAAARVRWYNALARAGTAAVTPSRRPRVEGPRARTPAQRVGLLAERVTIALVGLAAVTAMGALALLFAGYRPLVVRSGSMVPALHVGDLAIVEDVRADAIHVGDVVTFADPEDRGDTITHRVRVARNDGELVHFETRGDANDDSEFWSAATGEIVGRFAWRVPAVGRVASPLGSPPARVALGTVAVSLLVAPLAGRYMLRAMLAKRV
jgi:signal peptidase I